MTRESNRPRRWGTVISKACLVIVGLLFMAPFAWMFFSALKPSSQVLASGTALFGDEIRWDNFTDAFTSIPFGQILINTFAYAIAGSLIVVVVSVLNAYAFARLEARAPFPAMGCFTGFPRVECHGLITRLAGSARRR